MSESKLYSVHEWAWDRWGCGNAPFDEIVDEHEIERLAQELEVPVNELMADVEELYI